MKTANKTKDDRRSLYIRLYTIVSKATAQDKIYIGTLKDLFKDVSLSAGALARFMWVITHKTDAIPKPLFKLVDHGVKGIELYRINSGFYTYANGERTHIYGIELIPYIMMAVTERRNFLRSKYDRKLSEMSENAQKPNTESESPLSFDPKIGDFVFKDQETQLPAEPAAAPVNSLEDIPTEILEAEIQRRMRIKEVFAYLQDTAKGLNMSTTDLLNTLQKHVLNANS